MEWKGGGGGLCRVRGRAHYDVAKVGGRRGSECGTDLRGSSHSGGCESFGAAAQQVLKWRIVNGPPEQQRTVNNNWQAAQQTQ